MSETYTPCINEAGVAQTMGIVKPMVDMAMTGFNVMVEAAAEMNQAGKSRALFDAGVAEELERINDSTSQIMGHQMDVGDIMKELEVEGCPSGKGACAATCQKLGAMARLKHLLDNPPRLDPEIGKNL